MGRVKSWGMDQAEKKIDTILTELQEKKITRQEAKDKLLNDELIEMFGGVDTLNADDILDKMFDYPLKQVERLIKKT
jgi:hypothetical protein